MEKKIMLDKEFELAVGETAVLEDADLGDLKLTLESVFPITKDDLVYVGEGFLKAHIIVKRYDETKNLSPILHPDKRFEDTNQYKLGTNFYNYKLHFSNLRQDSKGWKIKLKITYNEVPVRKFDIFEFASKGKKSKDNRLIESVDVPKLIERILPGFHFEKHNVIESEGVYWFSNQRARDEEENLSILLKICKDEKTTHKEMEHLAVMISVSATKTNIKIGDELFVWISAVNPSVGGSILFRRKNVVVDTGSLLFKERLKLAEKIDKALQEKSEYVKFKKIFQHVKKGDYEVREEVA